MSHLTADTFRNVVTQLFDVVDLRPVLADRHDPSSEVLVGIATLYLDEVDLSALERLRDVLAPLSRSGNPRVRVVSTSTRDSDCPAMCDSHRETRIKIVVYFA